MFPLLVQFVCPIHRIGLSCLPSLYVLLICSYRLPSSYVLSAAHLVCAAHLFAHLLCSSRLPSSYVRFICSSRLPSSYVLFTCSVRLPSSSQLLCSSSGGSADYYYYYMCILMITDHILICIGFVLELTPPQCSGPRLEGPCTEEGFWVMH